MKLTKAEYRLLDALNSIEGGEMMVRNLNKATLKTAAWMAGKGLLMARAWAKGYVVATALGKRSHSYGKR